MTTRRRRRIRRRDIVALRAALVCAAPRRAGEVRWLAKTLRKRSASRETRDARRDRSRVSDAPQMAERKAEARAMAAAMQRMAAAQNMSAADAIASACDPEHMKDPCGDCDQSELQLATQQGLFQLWCRGGNLALTSVEAPERLLALLHGVRVGQRRRCARDDCRGRVVWAARAARVQHPVFAAARGCSRAHATRRARRAGLRCTRLAPDHLSVVKLLLEARARANAKDIMGNTPLARAAGSFSTEASTEDRAACSVRRRVRARHVGTGRLLSRPLATPPASCRTQWRYAGTAIGHD